MSANPSPLSDYAADVERYFDEKSTTIISNRDKAHAAVLISALFRNAEKEVVVFTRHFDGEFYSNPSVKEEITAALDRGVKIRVLIQENPGNLALIDSLTKGRKVENISIKQCRSGTLPALSDINFTVMDGRAFRLERDRTTHEAFACANNPETAKRMLGLFNSFEKVA